MSSFMKVKQSLSILTRNLRVPRSFIPIPTMKYILVTGGVISGIGKGVIASSIGKILKTNGYEVTAIKIDPYINIDAGTFSPYEHGEVFVLDDGSEVDLDLGNYERFMDIKLHKDNNITTGKIYQEVINMERKGDFLGKTVQVVPHITDAIQDWVQKVALIPVHDDKEPEICIVELGGTIGDIEGMPFVESFRQFQFHVKRENFCCVHVSLVPQPKSTGEHKTKPTQASVRELRGLGLSPDLVVCRSEKPMDESIKNKVSNFCHVPPDQVICLHDMKSVYHVPIFLEQQGLVEFFHDRLSLPIRRQPRRLTMQWRNLVKKIENLVDEVTISLVGKYTDLEDAYASVSKALQHASMYCNLKLNLKFIAAAELEPATKESNPITYFEAWQNLCKSDGVIVPGGFGTNGFEGKIAAIEWARKNQKPFLGICLGFQLAVVEFARNVVGWADAHTIELSQDKSKRNVVIEMEEHHTGMMGGTMRLGKKVTNFTNTQNSILWHLYGRQSKIEERHRHRYEVDKIYVSDLESAGMKFVGQDDTGERLEIMELEGHPYFIGVQFHPEYISRPLKPSPPYLGLILASCGKLNSFLERDCQLPVQDKVSNGNHGDAEPVTLPLTENDSPLQIKSPSKKLPVQAKDDAVPIMLDRLETVLKIPTMKYILVTGGVISGIGKGVIASSIGKILKTNGYEVTAIKIDPYINIDAGTFSPYEHGEVFVLDDGGEVDLDLGNYERFLDIKLHRDNNITTGKIYQDVINKERKGEFLGKTVQVVPHITNAIQEWVEREAVKPVASDKEPEICIIELGGTIGDIEGMPFIEAFRQFQFRVKRENFCCVHVSLVPQPKSTGEHKTKPTQASVRELRGLGLSPDLIVCRSEQPMDESIKNKVSNFCHVPPELVICLHDLKSVYHVPIFLEDQGLVDFFHDRLHLPSRYQPRRFTSQWRSLTRKMDQLVREVTISLVGKYTGLEDAYASVTKALHHSALHCSLKLNLKFVAAADLEPATKESNPISYFEAWQNLCKSDGVLVPGGFGTNGIEGKIAAIEWARKNKKPFLGICLGFQLAVVEFARNVVGWPEAHTIEITKDKRKKNVVIEMEEHHTGIMGGTMRLGKKATNFTLTNDSILWHLYGKQSCIEERHRHRYEVDKAYVHEFEAAGLRFVGQDDSGERLEILELQGHPYFVGVQFHPEYLSRPLKASPPYLGLVLAACGKLDSYIANDCQFSPHDSSESSGDDLARVARSATESS